MISENQEEKFKLLETALKMHADYSIGSMSDIIASYLTEFLNTKDQVTAKKFLDTALECSYHARGEEKNEISVSIADKYVALALIWEVKRESCTMLETARGLYYKAGLKTTDEKLKKIDEILEEKYSTKEK